MQQTPGSARPSLCLVPSAVDHYVSIVLLDHARMTNPKLIDAVTLQLMLRSENRPHLIDTRLVEEWAAATLPGAISLNVYDYFIPQSDPAGIATMRSAAHLAYSELEIDERSCVFFEQKTGMRSPRGLWFDEFIGRSNGAILDGGVDAWLAAGFPVEPGGNGAGHISGNAPGHAQSMIAAIGSPTEHTVAGQSVNNINAHVALVATIDEVLAADGVETVVLDVRRRSEFNGSFVHDCCARNGRVPDARFIFWEDVLSEGQYRDAGEMKKIAALAGISPAQRVIIYCHRGARAATVRYALLKAGFEDVAIFVGSWHEWAQRQDLPVQLGEPASE